MITVRSPLAARKTRLQAALVLAGLTQAQFAKQHGVTLTHLQYVLRGKRESPRLDVAIEDFIAKYLKAA